MSKEEVFAHYVLFPFIREAILRGAIPLPRTGVVVRLGNVSYEMPDVTFTSDMDVPVADIEIVPMGDELCKCDCATTCPLGRTGMATRCTMEELRAAGKEMPPAPEVITGD